jgi:hypothetical protein
MAPVSSTSGIGRIAVGSFIGTAIEFYDFYIYGTATALVLNATFFPTLAPVNATLASSRRSRWPSSAGRSAPCCSATSATGSAGRRPWSPRC